MPQHRIELVDGTVLYCQANRTVRERGLVVLETCQDHQDVVVLALAESQVVTVHQRFSRLDGTERWLQVLH